MGLSVLNIILVGMFSFIHSSIAIPDLNKDITIEVRILRVPAFQSIMKSAPPVEIGVAGVVIGGNVTASFPEGLVILETSSDKEYSELIQLIKDEISSYPCSCGDFVSIIPYAKKDININPITGLYDGFELQDPIFIRGIIVGNYLLSVEPIITNNHNLILNFEINESHFTAQALHEPKNFFKKELFNQALEMGVDKTLLVGFAPPKLEGSSRGSAYWLIFSLKD